MMEERYVGREKCLKTNALVAQHVMGWVWLERDLGNSRLRALFPPEMDSRGWERVNYYAPAWRPAAMETPVFSDWYMSGIRRVEGSTLRSEIGLPDYFNSIASAWEVVEKMQERFTWLADYGKDLAWIFTSRDNPGITFHGNHPTRPERAICTAALRAFGVRLPRELVLS